MLQGLQQLLHLLLHSEVAPLLRQDVRDLPQSLQRAAAPILGVSLKASQNAKSCETCMCHRRKDPLHHHSCLLCQFSMSLCLRRSLHLP